MIVAKGQLHMFGTDNNDFIFADGFTDDMLGKNEKMFHNKKVYIFKWCSKYNNVKNNSDDVRIFDASEFITNHKLCMHILFGSQDINDCSLTDIYIINKCDIVVDFSDEYPIFWLVLKR